MPRYIIESIVRVKNGITYWESVILDTGPIWNPTFREKRYFLHTTYSEDGRLDTTLRGGRPFPKALLPQIVKIENTIKYEVSANGE